MQCLVSIVIFHVGHSIDRKETVYEKKRVSKGTSGSEDREEGGRGQSTQTE